MKLPLQLGIVVFLFAVIPIIIRFISANSITIGVVRLTVASLFLGALNYKKLRELTWSAWRSLIILGLLFGAHWITYFLSIKTASASIGIISTATYGIHISVLGWLIDRETLSSTELLAIALAVIGMFLVTPELSLENNITLGVAFGVISGFCFALVPFVHKRCQHLRIEVRAFGQFFFALVFFLFFIPHASWDIPRFEWVWLMILAIPCTLVAHTLWANITTIIAPISSALLYYLVPSGALVLSFVILGETFTVSMLFGCVLILAGNIIGLLARHRSGEL